MVASFSLSSNNGIVTKKSGDSCPICGELNDWCFWLDRDVRDAIACGEAKSIPTGWEQSGTAKDGRPIYRSLESKWNSDRGTCSYSPKKKAKPKPKPVTFPEAIEIQRLPLSDGPQWQPTEKRDGNGFEQKIEYIYSDPTTGQPIGRVTRQQWSDRREDYDGNKKNKTFYQHHWNGKEWEKGKGDRAWPLYREKEACKLGGITILAEGEQCVEALASLGIPAACRQGGGNEGIAQRLKKYQPALVVWIADNDGKGREIADTVKDLLIAEGIPAIAINWFDIEPTLPPKGDVVDIINDFRQCNDDKEAIAEMIRGAIEFQANQALEALRINPPADDSEDDEISDFQQFQSVLARVSNIILNIPNPAYRDWELMQLSRETKIDVKSLLNLYCKSLLQENNEPSMSFAELKAKYGAETREWLMQGLLPKSTVVLLHAMGGVGKTLLLYHLVYLLANGENWEDFSVTSNRRKILIVQTDEPACDLIERLENRGLDQLPADLIRVKTRWSIDYIQELVREIESGSFSPDVIMIDSLTTINRNAIFSENDSEYARPILQLRDVAQRFGITILLIHHSNRAGQSRGTTAIFNSVSEVWKLEPAEKSPTSCDRLLSIEKSRSRAPGQYRIRFNPDDYSWEMLGKEGEEEGIERSTRQLIFNFLSRNPNTPYESEEIRHAIGGHHDTVRKELGRLFADGKLNRKKSAINSRRYVYFLPFDGEKAPHPTQGTLKPVPSTNIPGIGGNTAGSEDFKNQNSADQSITWASNPDPVSNTPTDPPTDPPQKQADQFAPSPTSPLATINQLEVSQPAQIDPPSIPSFPPSTGNNPPIDPADQLEISSRISSSNPDPVSDTSPTDLLIHENTKSENQDKEAIAPSPKLPYQVGDVVEYVGPNHPDKLGKQYRVVSVDYYPMLTCIAIADGSEFFPRKSHVKKIC